MIARASINLPIPTPGIAVSLSIAVRSLAPRATSASMIRCGELLSGSIATGDSLLAALAMGADLGYVGSPFIATEEANAVDGYKDMIVDSGAEDIVYSSLFTGVWGNYLKGSITQAGMDPDKLPQADPSSMNFSSGSSKPKSWKEIWGAGQGIGAVKSVGPTADLVGRIHREFVAAPERLKARLG